MNGLTEAHFFFYGELLSICFLFILNFKSIENELLYLKKAPHPKRIHESTTSCHFPSNGTPTMIIVIIDYLYTMLSIVLSKQ